MALSNQSKKIQVNYLQECTRLNNRNNILFDNKNCNYRSSMSFFRCILQPDEIMSYDIQAQCLPADLRGDRRTIKLIRVYLL